MAKRLKHMTGATAVFFSEYDAEDRVLVPMAAEIDSRLLNKGLEILGRDLSDVKSPVNAEMHAEIVATTVGNRRTLSEATFGAVGRLAGAAVQKIMRADRFIVLAHVVDGRLYGTSMLAMPAGVTNPPHDWLESIANIFAVALRRRLAEQELAESESRFRSYLEHAPIGVFVHDASGRFLQVNPAACRITGYDRASLLAMGILAASVAHEINNPLSYVLYNLESLDQDLPGLLGQTGPTEADAPPRSSGGVHPVDPETVQDVLERFKDAIEGSKRIASIAHSLSTFARVEKDTAEPIDVELSI